MERLRGTWDLNRVKKKARKDRSDSEIEYAFLDNVCILTDEEMKLVQTTKEYQSRQYCKDKNCAALSDDMTEWYCDHCGAYRFHQWLKNNGYRIVKEVK